MIQEDYVSFETAKLLKENGFDEVCKTAYETITNKHEVEQCSPSSWGKLNQVKRPTLQMAMKWLREKHNLTVDVFHYGKWMVSIKSISDDCLKADYSYSELKPSDSYEEACEAAIRYGLQNLI